MLHNFHYLRSSFPRWPRILILFSFFCLVLFPAFSRLAADPVSSTSYTANTLFNGKAVAVDPSLNRLYLGVDTPANDNLYVFSLDSQGDVDIKIESFNYGFNTRSLALNTQLKRLYMANHTGTNELYVLTLNEIGNVSSALPISFFSVGAKALALDAQRGCLYVALNSTDPGLGVVGIDSSGNTNGTFSSYNINNQVVYSLALDAARNKLYMGCGDGQIRVYELNAAGIPLALDVTSYEAAVGPNPVLSLALDSVRNRLHACLTGDSNIYTFTLKSDGDPQGAGVSSDMESSILCLNLDATRNRMYLGRSSSGLGDLGWIETNSSDGNIVVGVPQWMGSSADTIWSIVLDAQRQRIYTAATQYCCYYNLTDPPMTSFWINDGGPTTTNVMVNLKWRIPNARFVCVDKGSHLDCFYFPVTSPANTDIDTWISTDANRWSNDLVAPFSRANTLTVQALLSSGYEQNTIKIWFAESTGASNVSGLMRCETASIRLEADGTPSVTPSSTPTSMSTPTPSVTPSSTSTSTSTPTPSVTPSSTSTSTSTPTPSVTPSLTSTSTSTSTPSVTPSPTPTSTSTPTPSVTPSPVPSNTSTPTHTATPSPTPTFTYTHTPTPTNTSLYSPTNTPSPTPSNTPMPTPSSTPTFTYTHTPTPTNTSLYSPTITPSNTPSPTLTPTSTPTPSRTLTYTISPTSSITPTCTISPTITPTPTISPTLPPTPTFTPCAIFYLDKNRFTPGRESLEIKVGVLKAEEFKITIFTLAGRQVWQVRPRAFIGGYFRLEWDGCNQEGQEVASGVYFVVLESHGRREIRKVLVVK